MNKSIALKDWADAVKARDGKCVHCGTDQDLHSHHIKPKRTHPELKLDVSNGITLCYRCHKREHERNRPPRLGKGSRKPQRKTLERRIGVLEERIADLEKRNQQLVNRLNEYEKLERFAAERSPGSPISTVRPKRRIFRVKSLRV